MKTVVIYHKADFDGIFCREIAWKFLPDAILIGWDYGDPVEDIRNGLNAEDQLYMLDISVDGLMDHPGLIWIDHHKSAIEKFKPSIPGYRIDGVAACRLAWQWFVHCALPDHDGNELPSKQDFTDRKVHEPLAVRLAGEYDIGDKRDPHAELFQHGLRSCELSPHIWGGLLDMTIEEVTQVQQSQIMTMHLLENGRVLQYSKAKENESIIKRSGFDVTFRGLKFLACNHAMFNSFLFTAGIKPEHDALLGFAWDGKGWRVSLYHAPGKEHHDLSVIATSFGGGGHRGACGFRMDQTEVPFKAWERSLD